tara:strand:- start:5643 stop:6518 length:876 start_codon:yes stop_codon:yes gene_type:complete
MDFLIIALLIGIIFYLVIRDRNGNKEDSRELITSMEKINSMQETVESIKDLNVTFQDPMTQIRRFLSGGSFAGKLGEWNLQAIVKEIIPEGKFKMQDQINPKTADLVDCSVQTADGMKIPIDSKFFSQQYDDYQDSRTKSDRERALNKLKNSLLNESEEIQRKYILDGITYKLAILYLPSEKLISLVDLIEGIRPKLLTDHQVFVLGPSSLAAFLETVRMGHETYTFNEKAEKVSQVLNEIKDEFSNWSGTINELEKAAEQTVSKVAKYKTRENALSRKIRKIDDISEDNP